MKSLLLLAVAITGSISLFAQPAITIQRAYGGSSWDAFSRICIAKNGDLLFGGTSYSPKSGNKTQDNVGQDDVWIVRAGKTGEKKWDKVFGGSASENFEDMSGTADSGFIVAATSSSNISGDKSENSRGGIDYWIVKLNKAGNKQWDKTFGGTGNDAPLSVQQTTDGGYIVAGWSLSPASGDKTGNNKGGIDVWLVKLTASGTIEWNKTIGGNGDDGRVNIGDVKADDDIHSVVCRQTPDGGYLIGTSSTSDLSGDKTANSRGGSDYWIIKTDGAGNVVWDKTIGGSGNDYLNAVELSSDGGYLVGGYSASGASGEKSSNSKGGFDYWIVKLNSTGTILWDKTIGGGSYDVLTAIQQTTDGGYVLGGFSRSGKSGDKSEASKGDQDYWIVKTNNTGNVIWDKTIGGDYVETYVDVKQTAPNTYCVGGWSYSDLSGNKRVPLIGNSDYWIVGLTDDTAATNTITNKIVVAKDNLPARAFIAFPNPAVSVIHIQVAQNATFVLSDQTGKKVLTKTGNGNLDLDVSHVAPGVYYLNNTTTGTVQKIVIVR